jgi:hypothetical protein
MAQTVKINGQEFNLADLSDTAKKLLANIRLAEARLNQLKQEASLVDTARTAYAQALMKNLPK